MIITIILIIMIIIVITTRTIMIRRRRDRNFTHCLDYSPMWEGEGVEGRTSANPQDS